VIVSDFVDGPRELENQLRETDDEVGQLGLADAVSVLEPAALAATVAVRNSVLSSVACHRLGRTFVGRLRVASANVTCKDCTRETYSDVFGIFGRDVPNHPPPCTAILFSFVPPLLPLIISGGFGVLIQRKIGSLDIRMCVLVHMALNRPSEVVLKYFNSRLHRLNVFQLIVSGGTRVRIGKVR